MPPQATLRTTACLLGTVLPTLPVMPSAQVRLKGQMTNPKDPEGHPVLVRILIDAQTECNKFRVLAGLPQQPPAPPSYWAGAGDVEEEYRYDGDTGAARFDRIGPTFFKSLPGQERPDTTDCTAESLFEKIVKRRTSIWAADGFAYDIDYDKDGLTPLRVRQGVSDDKPTATAPTAGLARRQVLGQTCIEMPPSAYPLTQGTQRCHWEPFAKVSHHKVLPMPLETVMPIPTGDVETLKAVSASLGKGDPVDALPHGVPMVPYTPPPPKPPGSR